MSHRRRNSVTSSLSSATSTEAGADWTWLPPGEDSESKQPIVDYSDDSWRNVERRLEEVGVEYSTAMSTEAVETERPRVVSLTCNSMRMEQAMQALLQATRELTDAQKQMTRRMDHGPGSQSSPKFRTLMDGDNIEDYLTQFERLMVFNDVSEEEWVCQLVPVLSG